MEKGTKKHISDEIERLAVMIAKGFAATATKDEMNQRFEEMEQRFEQVNERLDRADGRLMRIELGYGTRLERAEDNIRLIKTKIGMP